MKKYTADYIFLPESGVTKHVILSVDGSGRIIEIYSHNASREDLKESGVEVLKGIIVPGFVNAHCHLELSHMKGLVPTGTGLIPFILDIVGKRNHIQQSIPEAIKTADAEMYQNGIQVVGDISNGMDSFETKEKSSITYYTFVETFDFLNPLKTEEIFRQAVSVYDNLQLKQYDQKTIVPHAPYSCTPGLFDTIQSFHSSPVTMSIHNQETPSENEFLRYGTGTFKEFYANSPHSLENFQPIGRNACFVVTHHLHPQNNLMLVHNTTTSSEDVLAMQEWSDAIYWVTCPNANLYIENSLPDYGMLMENNVKICIGTDSIASNWQLSIWEEMRTIGRYNSWISLNDLLVWGTKNGAQALDLLGKFGQLKVGTQPGIIHIHCDIDLQNWYMKNSLPCRLS